MERSMERSAESTEQQVTQNDYCGTQGRNRKGKTMPTLINQLERIALEYIPETDHAAHATLDNAADILRSVDTLAATAEVAKKDLDYSREMDNG